MSLISINTDWLLLGNAQNAARQYQRNHRKLRLELLSNSSCIKGVRFKGLRTDVGGRMWVCPVVFLFGPCFAFLGGKIRRKWYNDSSTFVFIE